MIFKNHASREQGLSDLLNYAHFIDDGIILNKDGAFLITYKFRGPDIYSASEGELDALTGAFNRMLTFLDDGWMLHVDELRVPSIGYSPHGYFPDPVSQLIDDSRRQNYETVGEHYENFQFITFVWKFPLPLVKTTRHWFVEGATADGMSLSKLLVDFNENVQRCTDVLRPFFLMDKLDSDDLLSYLNTCITGELAHVKSPPEGCFLDVVLGRANVVGGYVPHVGDKHVVTLSLIGYLNTATVPGLLESISTYPLIYRTSNRFIALSEGTAAREMSRYQRNWSNKVKGLLGVIKETITGNPTQKVNSDAQEMGAEVEDAIKANSQRTTRFGYWTSQIVLMHEDLSVLEEASKSLAAYTVQCGFTSVRESVNAFDAWLGSIPGNGSANVRRFFISGENLAHVLPLHSLWVGDPFSSPSSLLPKDSPPVFYASTAGNTPFRFHSDVADVGHQVVLGPTGAGKSTYLGFLMAQFLRYENAQIFVFDKDGSHKATTLAMSGHHYDIGNNDTLSFCPLAQLETTSQKVRASQLIEDMVILQGVALTPDIRTAIYQAIESLSHEPDKENRSLTVFCSLVQHDGVRKALNYYTLNGQIKLLDATNDSMATGHLHTFEMNWLLGQKPEVFVPVLRYIFDHIEAKLEAANGAYPTLIVLEEAWLYLCHPIFANKIKEWLKTLRKKNARVIFTTLSLADLYDPSTQNLTQTTASILESCPTKIYLPNSQMDGEIRSLYRKVGLTERQVEIIEKIAEPKKHYYVVRPDGNRLIDLSFSGQNALPLSFVGLSKDKGQRLIECKQKYGNEWLSEWLRINDLATWAEANCRNEKMAA